jgi:hypothetical protein
MKIRRARCGLWAFALLSACAEQRATEPAAPASSPGAFAAPPAAEVAPSNAAPALAPPAPAAAPAPQGLDQAHSAESRDKDEEFTNLEAAERALNQAKSELDRLALADAPVQVGRAAPADGAPKAAKKEKNAHAASAGAAAASSAPAALCDNACRAFASLSRAASAVCRLDGDGGSHCSRAKKVVADSQQRVSSCACQNGD